MVEVELEIEEYEIIEKWFGLIFGRGDKYNKPTKQEVRLFNKLAMMHIQEMNNLIKDAEQYESGEE